MLRIFTALFFTGASLVVQGSSPHAQHSLEVSLTPETGEILIEDQVLLSGRDQYRFQLAPWLRVEGFQIDGRDSDLQRQAQDYFVQLPDGNPHKLGFILRGVVPQRDIKQEYPQQALSSSGSDGVYLPGSANWIPLDWHLRASYRVTVTVPPGQLAVATGKLVSEQNSEQGYRAIFETVQSSEIPALFAGPYQMRERLRPGLRLRTYFHDELDALSEPYLDMAEIYIQRYAASIGTYPYADFHVISAPLAVGLGFPNLTYVGRQVIPLPFMRTRSLAHEVLHNWWGNGISVDYASGNWAEGLTTYLADYALAAEAGKETAEAMRVKWLRDYAALPAERDQAITAFKSKQHQASQVVGYNKVAFVFHMLANEIGRPAFDQGLRQFWARHQRTRASWRDLQLAFEQTSGRDLDWFFVQWLQRSGAPRVSLGAHSVEQLEAGFVTRIEILQNVTGYRFQLPLLLATENGNQRHAITILDSLTRAEFVTADKPHFIQLDPESDIFRRLQKNETPPILRDVTLDPNTVTMIGSPGDDFIRSAGELASRLLDSKPRFGDLDAEQWTGQSLLLITTHQRLNKQLERLRLQRPPGLPDIAHSSAVWITTRADGATVLVVSVVDSDDLKSLLRPLPHYGGQSYILFEAGHALARGVWPLTRAALYRDL
ncbi:MAG: M1 family metallopeptidase [Gammaproteobacteria bacterium]|nr:M1 family metallopeptidase [Gammaproteobacteria bacterium]